jgi:hypothetical protein
MLSATGHDKEAGEKCMAEFGNGIVAPRPARDMEFQGLGAD